MNISRIDEKSYKKLSDCNEFHECIFNSNGTDNTNIIAQL